MNVCACRRTVSMSSTDICGSRRTMCSRKSCGVTLDMSHLRACSTTSSHCYQRHTHIWRYVIIRASSARRSPCICVSVRPKTKKLLNGNWCIGILTWVNWKRVTVNVTFDLSPWELFLYFSIRRLPYSFKTTGPISLQFYKVMYTSWLYKLNTNCAHMTLTFDIKS